MKLLDQVRAKIRMLHYSYRTEQTYVRWIVAFVRFHHLRHPSGMGGPEIEEFLTHLAVKRQVSASTQNQALSAIVFLFKHILGKEPGKFKAVRAKQRRSLPGVLSQAEVQRVLDAMDGVTRLMAEVMYGGGLRLMECCRLQVKDVDLARGQIVVRSGKGGKDRTTMLLTSIAEAMERQLLWRREIHQQDLDAGEGWVELPDAVGRKYPKAA